MIIFLSIVTLVIFLAVVVATLIVRSEIDSSDMKFLCNFIIVLAFSCILFSLVTNQVINLKYYDGYPVDFKKATTLGQVYQVISQQEIVIKSPDGKVSRTDFIVLVREDNGDYRLFKFDCHVPEPGFIVTEVNGETKLIPHTPEPAQDQPQPTTPPATPTK
jgi:hypothetical protein